MDTALAIVVDRVGAEGFGMNAKDELLLIHRRMGHTSFSLLERLYLLKYEKADKQKLVCDECEFEKHTRSSYVRSRSRSSQTFDLVHSDVWGPCSTTEINGHKFFMTFIDCYTRTTWLYLMKNRSDVLACFKHFHKAAQTQYGAVVKALRSDNGTEYTNKAFKEYLSAHGMHHQTTCPYTLAKNEVAERKNKHKHLLEIV
jgi:transposase InsO family protein